MSIKIKTPEEIEKMRVAGQLAADVLVMIAPHVKAGVTTDELNTLCHDYIVDVQQAVPAPLNYHGFPKSICTSVNDVICHGIPNHKKLRDGDIINLDITVIKDGYHGDTSAMFIVGETTPLRRQLCKVAQESLYAAIKKVRPGACITEIGTVIQPIVEKAGFSVVRDYCGHGIGAEFHEEPQILHYRNSGKLELKAGMCFTIEPMVNSKKYHCKVNPKDGWTVTTKDGGDSAQWEHTLLVTEDGCEVLTLRPDDTIDRFIKHS
ncbi:type I methionyl aminopeptidase [Aeromonas veronii]|jgi:methionyl aminopeptidase|uniref:type I methionyl aminopeptidase n=1 Tax=Aeromonas TaxID=642 RepID=UPI0005C1BDB9|nr:type I methionyl aminopeptidase [Aeromonas veronii]RUR57885.1 type I methionyl aminopeptidase [Aeromonas veronii]TNI50431.1 type I methionyl aminopeptidase [Aeromonas veronii]TNI57346.1 type I methionyl aminopeptidase [Aeromonas veronii]TNI99256.1 type I methionyl aminopeptidase [Aeromonas veronii]